MSASADFEDAMAQLVEQGLLTDHTEKAAAPARATADQPATPEGTRP